jgi:hypothetical protein
MYIEFHNLHESEQKEEFAMALRNLLVHFMVEIDMLPLSVTLCFSEECAIADNVPCT